ncbi:MAG: signal peptidase I [Candidatus Eremiobacterota bacterium]
MTETQLIVILYVLVAARLGSHVVPQLVQPEARRRSVHEFIDSVVVAGVTALMLINFVVRSFYIPSGSMEQTLHVNDYILVNEFIYRFSHPMRGEVIVFTPPPQAGDDNKDYIKRVVGLEGDVLQVKDGWLFRNGQKLEEPYVNDDPNDLREPGFGPIHSIVSDAPHSLELPFQVPKGHLFVMGDNRNNSRDSRYWGPLPVQNVVGKAMVIFYPFTRIGILQSNSGTPLPGVPPISKP